MELGNFRRGRHLYSAERPSRWASAHILVSSKLTGYNSRERCVDWWLIDDAGGRTCCTIYQQRYDPYTHYPSLLAATRAPTRPWLTGPRVLYSYAGVNITSNTAAVPLLGAQSAADTFDKSSQDSDCLYKSHLRTFHFAAYSVVLIIRPHRRTTYVDAAYCYRRSSVVCQSPTLVSPAKTAEPIEMPFGLRTRVVPSNHVLDGVQIPMGTGNFEGGVGRPTIKYRDTLRRNDRDAVWVLGSDGPNKIIS